MADARTAPGPAPGTAAPPTAQPDTPPDRSAPPPRYPAQAVAGIAELWRHTQGGDPGITIGVVDGPPQLSHPSLTGADLRVLPTWWLPPTQTDPKMAEHGTWTASVLLGQPGSILPGLAPRCRALFLSPPVDEENPPDPLSGARAVEELVEAGADIIQFTLAFPTASHDADDMLKRAIARAIDAGVLITAPAGNDYGNNSIAPAILPGVLAVGAHRADGAMFYFSNHGPAYTGHGITALGEAVYGAHPDGDIEAQKGTCVAVALVTGAAALLISLQRHLGQPPDALAVRDALLATARPCMPEQSHGQTERCLNGFIDVPAATRRLLAAPSPGIGLSSPAQHDHSAPAPASSGRVHQHAPDVAAHPRQHDTQHLANLAWPQLTAHLADLADQAEPGARPALLALVRQRVLDVARGFVRAVMQRDYRQAAGAARWLALSGMAPHTLGLETGIDFLAQRTPHDPQAVHHLQAARALLNGKRS
ncbi:S8 family serine peptidase [Microtetraspora niveoalba]|uniref:S8 family serine peptidase n=1 Tax=Microtetraspora niveoalba TaxID=46175 RepID=UPI000ADEAFB4|nr:S8 family serine peptidase [Microtetraspora niveoalba]